MKKILISGINGYIGSYLGNYLVKEGFHVDGIIRNKNKISKLDKSIKFYVSDVLDYENLIIDENYDFFIHLAAANDIDSKNDKNAILSTTLGTKKALILCKKYNIKNFIFFSTFQVYGTDIGFINEKSKIFCKNDYAITHYFAEKYVENISKLSNINYLILQPTNIYGASIDKEIKRDTLVPNCFCKDLILNSKITLLSSGKQYRNFLSLNELSIYLELFIKNYPLYENKKLILASDLNLTIKEVALITKKVYTSLFNKEISIEILNNNPENCEELRIDMSNLPKLSFLKENMEKEIEKIFEIMS